MKQPSNQSFIFKKGVQGLGTFATIDFKKGEVLFELHGEILDHPTRTSIQIGKNQHIEDEIGGHINHNCHPNSIVDKETLTFISLKDIEPGEEITFDYNKNEDLVACPFTCKCCGKEITGKKLCNIIEK